MKLGGEKPAAATRNRLNRPSGRIRPSSGSPVVPNRSRAGLIIEALRQFEHDYHEWNIVARTHYEKQCRFRDLTSRLDMTHLENIKAADEVEGLLQDAWLVWRRVFATYRQIHHTVGPRQDIPDDILPPPVQPDPWPSPGGAG